MDPKRARERGGKREGSDPELLKRLFVCDVLPDAAIEQLSRVSRIASFPKGKEIDLEEKDQDGVVLGVLEGTVRLSLLSVEGRELPVLTVGNGHVVVLAQGGWTGSDPTIVTATSSSATCCLIPEHLFEQVVSNCPEAVILLLREAQVWQRELAGLAGDALHLNPDERIDHVLWREGHGAANGRVRLTQAYVAARARTDESRVSKRLHLHSRDGTITVKRKGHEITVLHPERLIEEDPGGGEEKYKTWFQPRTEGKREV